MQPRRFCGMTDIKVDPKDGLAVQDLSTLDASWLKESSLARCGNCCGHQACHGMLDATVSVTSFLRSAS